MSSNQKEQGKKLVFGETDPKQFQVKEVSIMNRTELDYENKKVTLPVNPNTLRLTNALTVGFVALTHMTKEIGGAAMGYLGDAIEAAPSKIASAQDKISTFKDRLETAGQELTEKRLQSAMERGDVATATKLQMKVMMQKMQQNLRIKTQEAMVDVMGKMFSDEAAPSRDEKK